jgi:hypothetical protein
MLLRLKINFISGSRYFENNPTHILSYTINIWWATKIEKEKDSWNGEPVNMGKLLSYTINI